MKKLLFSLLILCFTAIQAYAGGTDSAKVFGDVDEDFVYAVSKTSDGGYVIAGSSRGLEAAGISANGCEDFYIAKLDKDRNLEWQKLYGGSQPDKAYSIKQTGDGGYVVIGESGSDDIDGVVNHGAEDYYVLKLDKAGNRVWQKMLGGSRRDIPKSVELAKNDDIVIAGYSYSNDIEGVKTNGANDVYVVMLDKNGELKWQKEFGGNKQDLAYSITKASNGGFIIAGLSNSTDIKNLKNIGFYDYYILKISDNGELQWQKFYGGSNWDIATSVAPTSDGGYILAGRSASTDIKGVKNHGRDDFYILKLDQAGKIQWQKMYGGSYSESPCSISQTSDGGYIAAGETLSKDIKGFKNNGKYDAYLVKLDKKGKLQWQRVDGASQIDTAYGVLQMNTGEYLVAISSFNPEVNEIVAKGWWDIYLKVLDNNGQVK